MVTKPFIGVLNYKNLRILHRKTLIYISIENSHIVTLRQVVVIENFKINDKGLWFYESMESQAFFTQVRYNTDF